MKLLMISGDRSVLSGKRGPFVQTLEGLSNEFERIDVVVPQAADSRLKTQDTSLESRISGLPPHVYFHPSPKGLWYQPFWILKCGKKLFSLFHHDVMTVHEYPPFYNGIGALLLRRATKLPMALEIHHLVGFPRAASFTERIGYILSRIWLPIETRMVSAVRVVSRFSADTLERFGVPRRVLCVVPSFYLERTRFVQFHAPQTKRYDLSFCARLVPNKGLNDVLRAVAKLPHVTLLVVGDGPEKAACEKLCSDLDITHRIEFLGWLPTPNDVLRAMTSAKIFVMNSLSEGGPRVALEAMACGMPVIVTKVGVMPDVIEEGRTGVFTTGDPTDLAKQISDLLANEALRGRLGEAAKGVLDRFTAEQMLGGYVRFLKETANKR